MDELRRYRIFNLTLIDLVPTLIIGLVIVPQNHEKHED